MADNKTRLEKYVVYSATIKPETGDHKGKKVGHGDVITLEPDEARKWSDLGYLRPFIKEDYDEGDYKGAENISDQSNTYSGTMEDSDLEDARATTGTDKDTIGGSDRTRKAKPRQ